LNSILIFRHIPEDLVAWNSGLNARWRASGTEWITAAYSAPIYPLAGAFAST
jgi:hypothetical protein